MEKKVTMSGLGFKVQAPGLKVEGCRGYDRDLSPLPFYLEQ